MRNNLERSAWIILLSSFGLCVALGVMIPLGIRWYVRNAQMNQHVSLQVQRGPLSVVYGGRGRALSVSEDTRDLPEASRITAPNATSGRLVIEAPDPGTVAPIATVQLYDETECVLSLARSPRFSASPLPHRLTLKMEAGRVRVNVYGTLDRSTIVEVQTPQGSITLTEGSYEVKINAESEATVRYGQAVVVGDSGDESSLGPGERAILRSDGIDGPLPAARNLVANGDFQDPLESGWQTYNRQTDPQQSPGRIELVTSVVDNEETTAVNFYRDAVNHAELGITQAINYDVRDFASLELQMAVNIAYQNILGFGGCGYLGSECPIIVRINYRDIHGADREWLHGFYTGRPAEDWLLNYWAESVEIGTWQAYSSGNLMEELAGTPPAVIQSLTVHASGHSFDALVTEVELLAQE